MTDTWPRPAVLAITLERTGCFGECPTYIATVAEDDLVEWSGIANVPLLGTHCLDIGSGLFAMLADLIEKVGFFQWQESYANLPEDVSTTRLTVCRGGDEKTLWQHGVNDPRGFQLAATAIDGALCWPLWSNRFKHKGAP